MDPLRNGTPNSSSSTCTVRNLIEAVAKIRHQKQCATVMRIHKAVRQQLQRNIDVEEVIQQLAIATNSGALWRVDNNGVTSYREPPKGSSKEQVRWSQKEAVRWPNKESQMADQFSWSEARRWTESWNVPEPVRQHLGDAIAWPMNEPLKRQMNESMPWASPEQYRITVQDSFPWPMPAEPFAWPVTEPWRQTMIEQFKRAEGSSNFAFENSNYRSQADPSQKGLMNDQWTNADDDAKQQKCSLTKDAFHISREMSSMNASQNSDLGGESILPIDKQHKTGLGVCMVNQAFPDAAVKNVSQVDVDLDCRSSWYLNKADQIMSFPVQERKDFGNSCSSPSNYIPSAFATENVNTMQTSSNNQHISSHFYETNGNAQAGEVFSSNIQTRDENHPYNQTFLEGNSMYCNDRTYKPVADDEANKPPYHDHFEPVTWTNYPGPMHSNKMCFDEKLGGNAFISGEGNIAQAGGMLELKDESKVDSKTGKEFVSSSTDEISNCNTGESCIRNSPLLQQSEKPPDLTIFPSNFQENECADRNAMEASSPPILGEPLVEMMKPVGGGDTVDDKAESCGSDKNWSDQSEDCRKSCDNSIANNCHHLKNAGSPFDLNDSVFKSSPMSSANVSLNKIKPREAPLPILEKLTPLSLKSELGMSASEKSTLSEDGKTCGGSPVYTLSDYKLKSCRHESGGHKRKLNIFETIAPSAKCSKVARDDRLSGNLQEGKVEDDDVESDATSAGRSAAKDVDRLPVASSTFALQMPTDIHLRGLVDGLTRFFTPTNKRPSRVSQNAVQRSSPVVQSNLVPSLRKPPPSPSFAKVKKIFSKTSLSKTSAASSPSPGPSVGATASCSSSMPRKPRREQLIDGLSHFFSAQGKRRTRFNRSIYNERLSNPSGDEELRARSQSSSGSHADLAAEVVPRSRASSANASTSPLPCATPLCNVVRWSSDNQCCRTSGSRSSHLSPQMISRLKSTKWLSITRKQPEPLFGLNSDATTVSSTRSNDQELPAPSPPNPSGSLGDALLLCNASGGEETNNPSSKSNPTKEADEPSAEQSKLYCNKPSNEDLSLFKKARDHNNKKFSTSLSSSSGTLVNLSSIQFGEFKIEVSYLSNFPIEFSSLPVLYFCEFCLKYFKSSSSLQKHLDACTRKHPPGNEVYRPHDGYSVYEVDACTNVMYCESLCSVSQLFVEPELQMVFSSPSYLFYVLTKNDVRGSHLIGYFVRDRHQGRGPCLVFLFVLPPHRRKGHATFLINFSYQLCKLLNVPGYLKRMFSVPVLSAFQQYWCWAVLDFFQNSWNHKQPLTIKNLSTSLGISGTNITSTLLKLGIIQAKTRSKNPFNPNVRAIESNAKELLKKEKSLLRINLKNVKVEYSVLLRNKITPEQISLINCKHITSEDEMEDHLDNDDSGICLHCTSCGESQQESVNSSVSDRVDDSNERPEVDAPGADPSAKSPPVVERPLPPTQDRGRGSPQVPPKVVDVADASSGNVSAVAAPLPPLSVVKKESRSVEVQTDAYESEYSSDEYDDDEDDGDDDDNNDDGNGTLENCQVDKDEIISSNEAGKVLEDENSNLYDGLANLNETLSSQHGACAAEKRKDSNQSQDSNNNTDRKTYDHHSKKVSPEVPQKDHPPNVKAHDNLCISEHLSPMYKESTEKVTGESVLDSMVSNALHECRNVAKKASHQIKRQEEVFNHNMSEIESLSYVNQLPSPANSDMRSPSSVSSYPMSNHPPGKVTELGSEKMNSNDQNVFPSSAYQDKGGVVQAPNNKYPNECYMSPDAANVPTSSSPAVYTGLYFNNPLNPLFINQNSPSNINCNHYNMPTPSPTNSSSRSFGMASPNSNNFPPPPNNPQLLDRGCPSAPMLTYGRVACPQPANDGQFAWASIYHSQPLPAGYSFIRLPDQEIMQCGIPPFPSMKPIPDSFSNAISLGPPGKGLPAASSSQPPKPTNRKCGNKTCKSSASANQCNTFRSQSVAPNVTIQPGTNVITNYNVLNMNVTPDYRGHQSITYPSPPYIAATNPTFIGETGKQHINIYPHQPIGFPQQPQHHSGMYAAATYNYLNGAIAPQSFSINVNNIMK